MTQRHTPCYYCHEYVDVSNKKKYITVAHKGIFHRKCFDKYKEDLNEKQI